MDVQVNPRFASLTCGIAVGATASSPLLVGASQVGALRVGAVVFGTGYIGGTASFKAALTSGGPYRDLYDKSNVRVTIPAAAKNRTLELPAQCLVGLYGLKVIAATKQTPTSGACVISVAARD